MKPLMWFFDNRKHNGRGSKFKFAIKKALKTLYLIAIIVIATQKIVEFWIATTVFAIIKESHA